MRTWYHNITKQVFNESDLDDFFEEYTEGDKIMQSEDGCAIINEVTEEELKKMYTEYCENNRLEDEDEVEDADLPRNWLGDVVHQPTMSIKFNPNFEMSNLTTMVMPKGRCKCEIYIPTSTSGVIIDDCRNCGGKAPVIRTGL